MNKDNLPTKVKVDFLGVLITITRASIEIVVSVCLPQAF
jgi:hypothetical protein